MCPDFSGFASWMSVWMSVSYFLLILKNFIYFQKEGKGGRKRGKETSMWEWNIDWLPLSCLLLGAWPTTQACALAGNQTSDLLVPRTALSLLNHTSQGSAIVFNKDVCDTDFCTFYFKNIMFTLFLHCPVNVYINSCGCPAVTSGIIMWVF